MLKLGPSHVVFLSEHSFYVGELVFEHTPVRRFHQKYEFLFRVFFLHQKHGNSLIWWFVEKGFEFRKFSLQRHCVKNNK